MSDAVYTIGHSTHSIERFIALLQQHTITALCDVRSRPYSRVNPQFNREELKQRLRDANIQYVFLGKELGARTDDRSCYCNGKVQYDLLAKTALFKSGIDRVKEGARSFRLALMCAEKEPLECHRTILVSRVLDNDRIPIRHILADGSLEDHAHSLRRLVNILRLPTSDMFRSEEVVIEDAYNKQGQQIAYQEGASVDSVPANTRHSSYGAAE